MRLARVAALSVGVVSLIGSSPPPLVIASSQLPPPTTWTPAAASLLVYVDWQTLLSSPPLRGLEKALTEREPWEELEELRELTGMDPWRDAWAVSFFKVSAENRSSSWGLAIYGAFDPERVLDALRTRRRLTSAVHRETAIHLLDSTDDDSEGLAFPDSTTVLFGPVHQVRAMLDSGFGFAPSAADGELGPALEKLSMAETLWAVGKDASELPLVFARGTSRDTGVALRSFVVSARFGSDVDFEARGETSNREEARRLADLVKGLRAFTALQPSAEPGFLEVLETLEVETLDESVEITAEIEGKFLRDLLERSVKQK